MTVTTSVSADAVRVVLEASEKVPFRVNQEDKRVTVQVGRELIETAARPERLTGGIVDSVQFLGGRDNTFAMALGRRFLQLKTGEEDTRLVLEFQARPLSAASPLGSPAPGASPGQPRRPRSARTPRRRPRPEGCARSSSTPDTAARRSAPRGRAARSRRT